MMVDSIILLSHLVWPQIVELDIGFARVFEQKCKSSWKVRASAQACWIGSLSSLYERTE